MRCLPCDKTSTGICSPPTVAVFTGGVSKAFSAATLAGTLGMGVVTEMPIPSTSWHVEQRPKLLYASENNARPRAASELNAGTAGASAAPVGPAPATFGFAMPLRVAKYAATAVISGRDRVVPKPALEGPWTRGVIVFVRKALSKRRAARRAALCAVR